MKQYSPLSHLFWKLQTRGFLLTPGLFILMASQKFTIKNRSNKWPQTNENKHLKHFYFLW